MEHVPAPTSVTVTPETVHTEGVVEVKLTGRPELAEAVTTKGPSPRVLSLKAPKVMVWSEADPRMVLVA
jgi:hypothetical protein